MTITASDAFSQASARVLNTMNPPKFSIAKTVSQPHWLRGGRSSSRRSAATAKANTAPPTVVTDRMVNGGISESRNLACGQVRPQLHAVSSSNSRPSARVPIRPRGAVSADVNTDLAARQQRVGAQPEMDA